MHKFSFIKFHRYYLVCFFMLFILFICITARFVYFYNGADEVVVDKIFSPRYVLRDSGHDQYESYAIVRDKDDNIFDLSVLRVSSSDFPVKGNTLRVYFNEDGTLSEAVDYKQSILIFLFIVLVSLMMDIYVIYVNPLYLRNKGGI